MSVQGSAELEHELRARWQQGDLAEAARLLVEGYGPGILGYLVRTMRSEDDAAEVFGRFCEHLWRGLGGFEGRSSFKTWAYRLATHARTRFWQDPFRRRGVRPATGELEKIEQRVRTRTLRWLRTEVKDRFARLREQLDPDEQTLLTLRLDKELSWTEIAEVLAAPDDRPDGRELAARATALRQRFQRLKDRIRRLALAEGLLDGD